MIRVISDVHGKSEDYLRIIADSEYSVQVGDMGFDYSYLDNVDYQKNLILLGNHDNYDTKVHYNHFLGDYGYQVLGGLTFFHMRGAFSIDRVDRLCREASGDPKQWWHEEEITPLEGKKCLEMYADIKPDFMLTHAAPRILIPRIATKGAMEKFGYTEDYNSFTSILLQSMWALHEPKLWICGHFHKDHDSTIGDTRFICQRELGYVDVDKDLGLHFPLKPEII